MILTLKNGLQIKSVRRMSEQEYMDKILESDAPEDCPVKEAIRQKKPRLYILVSPMFCESRTCQRCVPAKQSGEEK
jgi:hypothetical protein